MDVSVQTDSYKYYKFDNSVLLSVNFHGQTVAPISMMFDMEIP